MCATAPATRSASPTRGLLFRTGNRRELPRRPRHRQQTGRPLQGALAAVVASDGAATPPPQPSRPRASTAASSCRSPPAPTCCCSLAPATRRRCGWCGDGRARADVFDPRLTPMAAFATLGPAGGEVGSAAGPRLQVPAGALAAATGVSATVLEEQALPALLPFGWSPQGAAWVAVQSGNLAAPATLTLPVQAPDGTSLVVAALDSAACRGVRWRRRLSTPRRRGAGRRHGRLRRIAGRRRASAPPAPVVGSALAPPRPRCPPPSPLPP